MMKEKMACCCRKMCFSRFIENFHKKIIKYTFNFQSWSNLTSFFYNSTAEKKLMKQKKNHSIYDIFTLLITLRFYKYNFSCQSQPYITIELLFIISFHFFSFCYESLFRISLFQILAFFGLFACYFHFIPSYFTLTNKNQHIWTKFSTYFPLNWNK